MKVTCEQKLPRQHPRYKGGNALHFDKFVEHIYQPRNMRRMIQHYPPLSASRMDRRRERARKLLGLPSLLLQPVLHTLSTIIWQALQFIINFICISINRAFLLLVYTLRLICCSSTEMCFQLFVPSRWITLRFWPTQRRAGPAASAEPQPRNPSPSISASIDLLEASRQRSHFSIFRIRLRAQQLVLLC